MDDAGLRHFIYRRLAASGTAPGFDEIAAHYPDGGDAAAALRRLHDAHAIVLFDDRMEVRMALPFSAVATPFAVVAAGRRWWANCAWDALAIPVALGIDASIEASWADTGQPVRLAVTGGELAPAHGFVHFGVPARQWWDDIVLT